MSDIDVQSWDKIPNEPDLWYDRFTRYRLLGVNRTLTATHREEVAKSRQKSQYLPGSWRDASKVWHWNERATAWDESIRGEQEAEVKRIMTEGYAAAHERVQVIGEIAQQLYGRLKGVKAKDKYPVMVLEQWRGLLDDLAQETGGRIKKASVDLNATFDVVKARETLSRKIDQIAERKEGKE